MPEGRGDINEDNAFYTICIICRNNLCNLRNSMGIRLELEKDVGEGLNKMKMPEKKVSEFRKDKEARYGYWIGYNRAHSDWLTYHNWRMGRLPDREEIENICYRADKRKSPTYVFDAIATALDKRIKNEKI